MKRFFTGILIFSAVLVGIVMFLCKFSAQAPPPPAGAGMPSADAVGVFLAMQANQYSLLQIHLVILSIILVTITIILAVAAIWGFNEIRDQIVKTLNKKIENDLIELARETMVKMGPEELARRIVEAQIETGRRENSKEVFREGIREMLGEPENGEYGD